MGPPRLSPRGELLLNRTRRMAGLGPSEMGALKIAPRPAADSPGGRLASYRARLMRARIMQQRNLPEAIVCRARLILARVIQQHNLPEAIAYHEAGYLVAASVAQVPVPKPRCNVRGLRRSASHVLDLEAITEPDDIYAAALVMLAGAAALRRYDASTSGSDEVEASALVFNGLFARFSGELTPAAVRTQMRLRCGELAALAEALVAERWCEIQDEAARLLDVPARLVGAPVRFRLILVALDVALAFTLRAIEAGQTGILLLRATGRASDRAMGLLAGGSHARWLLHVVARFQHITRRSVFLVQLSLHRSFHWVCCLSPRPQPVD